MGHVGRWRTLLYKEQSERGLIYLVKTGCVFVDEELVGSHAQELVG
jgi:hypothetical protein